MKCVNYMLEEFYSRYAILVYRYAIVFIIVPVALTICLSCGVLYLKKHTVNDTQYIITPRNGPYHAEAAAVVRNWPLTEEAQFNYIPGFYADSKHYFHIIITARKNYSLMEYPVLEIIQTLDNFVKSEYQLLTEVRDKNGSVKMVNFTYLDICMKWSMSCFPNSQIVLLQSRDITRDFNNGPPLLKWPMTRESLSDYPLYIGALIGQPVFNETTGIFTDFKALRLSYFTRQKPANVEIQSIQWRLGIQEYLKKFPSADFLNKTGMNDPDQMPIEIAFGNEDTLNQGLEETAYKFAPEIRITVILIFTFCLICSFFLMRRGRPNRFTGIDWVRSKPILAVAGIIEPGMAIMSTVGLLMFVGMEYNCIVVVMPFLVLAIGVDDMFIMIASWHGTKLTDPPEVRFAEALADAAVSISITAITDVISFGIGTWNSLPGVQIFCCFTAVAMFFELIYQCTFYAAVMALVGKAECQGRHCITFKKTIPLEDAKTTFQKRFVAGTVSPKVPEAIQHPRHKESNAIDQVASTNHQLPKDQNDELSFVQIFFRDKYGPLLLHPTGKMVALILFIIYFGTAVWGCLQMQNGLEPEKLVYREHYSSKYLKAQYYWDDGLHVGITVENPPNLTLDSERKKILSIVAEFENSKYTFNSTNTLFWMREYLEYLKYGLGVEDTRKQWCDDLKGWLRTDTNGLYILSIRWGNSSLHEDECRIKAFRFFIGAKQATVPATQVNVVPFFRNICNSYPQYKMSSYQSDIYPFTDQYLMINPTTIRNSIVSFVVMILICLILIPHPICGVFIPLATVFIDVGVGGYLYWWGVNMDVVSMITMIMATGIAIDLAAHVSYAYVRSDGTSHERAIKALESLGWPVFQGVTAMFLGVLVLATADSYMYQTFFKTVFLVIIFGLMHSVIFLPVALTVFAPTKFKQCCAIWPKMSRGGNKSNVAPVNGVVAPTSFTEEGEQKKQKR